jgi:hypothetical protein
MAVPDAGPPIGSPLGAADTGTPIGVGVGVEAAAALSAAVGVGCVDGFAAVAVAGTDDPAAVGGETVQFGPFEAAHPARTRLAIRPTSILIDRGPLSTDDTSKRIVGA